MKNSLVPYSVKKPLWNDFPEIKGHVIKFVSCIRSQLLQDTSSLIQAMEEKVENEIKTTGFRASRSWLQNFYSKL